MKLRPSNLRQVSALDFRVLRMGGPPLASLGWGATFKGLGGYEQQSSKPGTAQKVALNIGRFDGMVGACKENGLRPGFLNGRTSLYAMLTSANLLMRITSRLLKGARGSNPLLKL